jgi:glycosyltransferase involved in cell wall biosynthesis
VVDGNLINISFAILTKNSSETIEKTLNSIKNISNEIVILDTGSTDSTIEICKKYTEKIFITEWKNDFSFSRNELIEKCNTDFIFMIDSDEELKETSIIHLKKLLSNIDYKKVYAPKVIDLYKNTEKIRYVSKIIPNYIRFKGYLHEYPFSNHIKFEIHKIENIELIHYGYLNYEEKAKRNIYISEVSIKNSNNTLEKIKQYCYLIIENLRMSNFEKSKYLILDFLEILNKVDKFTIYNIKIVHLCFLIAIKSFISNNDIEFSRNIINISLEFYPDSQEILRLKDFLERN